MATIAKTKSGGWLDNIKTIVYAGLIAVGIRTIAFEPFNIPSGSMIPTLLVGDYLFVSKYAYGYSRYSIPFSPDLFSGRIFGSLPKRGDVAVFKNEHDGYADYIKRIVGLPGDHIQVRAGVLYINGQPAPRRPLGSVVATDESGVSIAEQEYQETLPGNVTHLIAKMATADDDNFPNNTPEYVVPPGNLFAMGDNRDNSLDSRFMEGRGVGFLPVENLVGRGRIHLFLDRRASALVAVLAMAVRNPLGSAADRNPVTEPGCDDAFGHRFRDPALLTQALTHRSAVPRSHGRRPTVRSNERLEFLGDRVLGLLMAEWLSERFPDEPEGLLARRHAELVAEPQLAAVGAAIGLADHLIIAPNEARAGVGRGAAVLADAVEAILGALFLDGGLDPARRLLRQAWAGVIDAQEAAPHHPKSSLKEWLEARGATLPPFVEQFRTGPPHALVFTLTVSAMGHTGTGTAATKQLAEREAAADLLRQLQA